MGVLGAACNHSTTHRVLSERVVATQRVSLIQHLVRQRWHLYPTCMPRHAGACAATE